MGYNTTKTNLKPRFVLDLLEKQAELPSSSEIAKADDMELEEIAKSTEDLISQTNEQTQTDDLFEHPWRELLGLDKQLRSIRSSLKVEIAKKVELDGHIEIEKIKLGEIQDDPRYTKKQHEELRKRPDKLNDELKVRQEFINLLKGRLKNQITSFKETIAKVLDKDTSLGEKSELCLESKELLLLPYSQLSKWPLGYLLKHYCWVGVLPWHQVANHLLKMKKV